MALNFESYAQKGHEFVNHVALELNTEDFNYAGNVTRRVLHALRNRITIEESFQIIAQLPMAIKAVYVDNWKISKKHERIKHINDFLDEVISESGKFGPPNFSNVDVVSKAVKAVFKTLARYVSAGEIENVLAVLPAELRNWLMESITV